MFNLLTKMTNNRSPDMMKLKTTTVQKSWLIHLIILQNLHRVKPQEVTVLKLLHKDHKLHSKQAFEIAYRC